MSIHEDVGHDFPFSPANCSQLMMVGHIGRGVFYHHFSTANIVIYYQYAKQITYFQQIFGDITPILYIWPKMAGMMELRIKELLNEQGLRMTDLANRMGTDASNLTKSLAKNPTFSTLQEVAKALNVHIHELFTRNIPMRPSGVMFTGDRAYGLVEMTSVVRIPYYSNYAVLRKDIKTFVRQSIEREKAGAFSAIVDGYEMISLVYDSGQKKFILTIYYGYSDSKTFFYDQMEFTTWIDEKGDNPVWDLDEISWSIIGDVENEVPIELGDLTTPADSEGSV